MSDADGGDAFVDRLGELVLMSFAIGQSVVGSWYFVHTDRMIPDVTVTITATGVGGSRAGGGTLAGTDPRPFDVKLESFLLAEFAAGEQVAGSWELAYSRGGIPTWTVDVRFDDVGPGSGEDRFQLSPPDGE